LAAAIIRTVSKLTLNVDEQVVSRAKRYAKKQGVSVSEMVETYLATVARPVEREINTPVLRALRGTLKKARLDDYRRHLASKYL
jgi:antitoxin component of RelBE/YafQ-DinJ toxin-antitoxin module